MSQANIKVKIRCAVSAYVASLRRIRAALRRDFGISRMRSNYRHRQIALRRRNR